LLSSLAARAQLRTGAPVRTVPDLTAITRRAGTIFAGRVVKVEPVRVAFSGDLASLQITCEVESGLRGALPDDRISAIVRASFTATT
jgi:hypothetical protein